MASEPADPQDREQPTERPESGADRETAPESLKRDTTPASTDSESDAAPTTPRSALPLASEDVVVEVASDPATERRARVSAQRRSGEDTLLSLPTPAEGDERSSLEPRFGELERRLQSIEARLSVLEVGGGGLAKAGKRWLAWIAFMVTLAVVWQVVRHYR